MEPCIVFLLRLVPAVSVLFVVLGRFSLDFRGNSRLLFFGFLQGLCRMFRKRLFFGLYRPFQRRRKDLSGIGSGSLRRRAGGTLRLFLFGPILFGIGLGRLQGGSGGSCRPCLLFKGFFLCRLLVVFVPLLYGCEHLPAVDLGGSSGIIQGTHLHQTDQRLGFHDHADSVRGIHQTVHLRCLSSFFHIGVVFIAQTAHQSAAGT